MKLSIAAVTALLAASASAHSTLQWFWPDNVKGTSTQSCVRQPPNNSPIENVNSADMACNINGGRPASSVCAVKAGSTVKIEWHHTNRAQPSGDDPIASSHKGPIMAYLAKVDNAGTVTDVGSLNWFKIQEEGLVNGVWAVDRLNAIGTGEWDVKIPANLANGQYLLRGEIIALHSAGNYPGAQFYMGCVQINVSGGGSGSPTSTVKFPGAYKSSDAGVTVNIYQGLTNYVIPGPRVDSLGGNNGGTPQPSSTSTPVVTPTSTPTSVPTNPPAGCTPSAKWAQCGGIGFSGCKTCVSGSTCNPINDYYHQCV